MPEYSSVYATVADYVGKKEAVREALRRWYAFIGVDEGYLLALNMVPILIDEECAGKVTVVVDLSGLNGNNMAGPFIGPGAAHIKALQTEFTFPLKTGTEDVDITKSVFAHALYFVFGKKQVSLRFNFN